MGPVGKRTTSIISLESHMLNTGESERDVKGSGE
jgi:hypothetical protein